MFAPNLTDLVMKVVALGFVATLDDLVFACLAPAKFAKEVAAGQVQYNERSYPLAWNIWGSFLVKAILVIFFLFSFSLFERKAKLFRRACRDYNEKFDFEWFMPKSVVYPQCMSDYT